MRDAPREVFRPRCAPGALPDAKSVMPDMKADDVPRGFRGLRVCIDKRIGRGVLRSTR